jgi:hypothetical protein
VRTQAGRLHPQRRGSRWDEPIPRMETLEHLARVTLLARMIGEPRPLAAAEVAMLLGLAGAPYR